MKPIYLFAGIISLLSFNSCKEDQKTSILPVKESPIQAEALTVSEHLPLIAKQDSNLIEIQVPNGTSNYPLEYTKTYIPLETTEECLIGNIDKIIDSDTCLYIADFDNNNVFRFGRSGCFINSFTKKGRGPGECVGICDFYVDQNNNEVCILDLRGMKLLYYSLDGKYLRETPFYYHYNEFALSGDYLWIYTGMNDNHDCAVVNQYELIRAKKDQTPLAKALPYPKDYVRESPDILHHIITVGNINYFTHALNDTIWQATSDGKLEAKFVFKVDNNDYIFKPKDMHHITSERMQEIESNTDIPRFQFATKDFVYAYVKQKGRRQLEPMIYSRNTGHILYKCDFSLYVQNLRDDPCGPCLEDIQINSLDLDFALQDGSLVRILQPARILELHKDPKSYLNKADRLLYNSLNEEDNPVLVLFHLKPF